MPEITKLNLGTLVRLDCDFETAVTRTTTALKAEGFGILTEIDVKETMKKKLDKDLLPYKILGACNPPLAYQALNAAPEVGLLLPCNVTVRQLEDGDIEVGFVDPMMLLGAVSHPELATIAEDARARLDRATQAIQ
ncbi:MAG TPA: DUF302 domain-containing protein [Anaerolineaceae bacterium]